MAAITDATLTNKDNSRVFLFRGVHNFKWGRAQPTIPVPIINAKPENNVLFRFSGQQDSFLFRFALFDDDTDVSNGTHGTTVKTIIEQIAYIQDWIYTEDYDVDWTLVNSEFAPGSGVDGVIENFEIDAEGGTVGVRYGTFSFMRGKIGAL